MTCEQIQLLLYLDRSGERTREEDALVAEHLRICSSCRVEDARIKATDVRIRAIVREEPACSHQDALIAKTMVCVSVRPDGAEVVLRWLGSHSQRIQYVLGTALAVICILFSVQSFHDARKLELLEQKTGRVWMHAPGSEAVSAGIRGLSGRVEANSFQTILSFLSHNTGERPQMLIDYWKKKYPALAMLQLTGNPTEKERRILATEGAALVQELTRWINAGGNYNEHH
jgi:hypothetical protein